MRATRLLMGVTLALALVTLAPGADAREVACLDAVRDSCPGFYCVDTNLDGRFNYGECMLIYCPTWGCQPPWE